MQFVTRREVLKVLNIHYQTLYKMIEREEIETVKIGKMTLYNLNKFLNNEGVVVQKEKKNICYCRVSSGKQNGDLDRQIKYMKEKYPNYEIISDIGSGLNFERKGLQKLMELGIKGEINEIRITYKDRLARIGYELIEWIIKKYSSGKIIIENKEEEKTVGEEMTKDLLSIMNIYVAKVNGLRSYKKSIKEEIKKVNIKNEPGK